MEMNMAKFSEKLHELVGDGQKEEKCAGIQRN